MAGSYNLMQKRNKMTLKGLLSSGEIKLMHPERIKREIPGKNGVKAMNCYTHIVKILERGDDICRQGHFCHDFRKLQQFYNTINSKNTLGRAFIQACEKMYYVR